MAIEIDKKSQLSSSEKTQDSRDGEIDSDDIVGLYLREVGQTPLLTAKQEVELFQTIERGRNASKKIAKGGIAENELGNLKSSVDDGTEAKNHVLKANQRLVISIAKKYVNRGGTVS